MPPKRAAKKGKAGKMTKKEAHSAKQKCQYESRRPKCWRPRLHLPPGKYMVLPVLEKAQEDVLIKRELLAVKDEPAIKKELDDKHTATEVQPVIKKELDGNLTVKHVMKDRQLNSRPCLSMCQTC